MTEYMANTAAAICRVSWDNVPHFDRSCDGNAVQREQPLVIMCVKITRLGAAVALIVEAAWVQRNPEELMSALASEFVRVEPRLQAALIGSRQWIPAEQISDFAKVIITGGAMWWRSSDARRRLHIPMLEVLADAGQFYTVGMSREDVAALDLQQAVDLWGDFRPKPR
ncbi:hypothetical protein ACQPZZ_03645 [Microbispora sp. CA-135349]|uniref:hypothetical protein n=1 Tax=Microbispora sp. CA-135349 TaxID=3239953 RepID=UPI003D8F1EE3